MSGRNFFLFSPCHRKKTSLIFFSDAPLRFDWYRNQNHFNASIDKTVITAILTATITITTSLISFLTLSHKTYMNTNTRSLYFSLPLSLFLFISFSFFLFSASLVLCLFLFLSCYFFFFLFPHSHKQFNLGQFWFQFSYQSGRRKLKSAITKQFEQFKITTPIKHWSV